jgi:hypothetical protein
MTIEEIQNELIEENYFKQILKDERIENCEKDIPDNESISEHNLKLLNLFLVHYNDKYETKEGYFANIKNEKDTTKPMELFFECIIEFKKMREKIQLEDEDEYINYYYLESEEENIKKMFELFSDEKIYCLIYKNKQIITPSLLICLNYISENKKDLFETKDWSILILKDN